MINYQSKPISVNWAGSGLCSQIQSGNYKIPKFQREYVWSLEDAAKLVDSVLKGYPIGTFIVWKTRERLRSIKQIGKQTLPEPASGSEIFYILDGQQRITSLYCALGGLKVEQGKGQTLDFANLYLDLEAAQDDDLVKIRKSGQMLNDYQIPLWVVAAGQGTYLQHLMKHTNNPDIFKKLDWYKQQLQTGYSYSVIQVENTPIEIATDMFSRINISGKQLSMFEIMCAKTYIEEVPGMDKGFDLYEEYENLVSELTSHEFDTIQSSTVLQVVSAVITGRVDKKSILSIDRQKFKEAWPEAKKAILKSINFVKENLGVKASRLLPYDSLLIPLSYFFYNYSGAMPTGNTKNYLEALFWHTSLSDAYSGSSNDEISRDIIRVKTILAGQKPDFNYSKAKLINLDKLKSDGEFRPGRSFIKAILCALTLKNPKCVFSGKAFELENDSLQKSNSRHFHFIFPKKLLDKQKSNTGLENSIGNILFTEGTPGQKIKTIAPEVYIKTYSEVHKHDFDEILSTNLLPPADDWKYEDYERFIEWRLKEIMNHVRDSIKVLD